MKFKKILFYNAIYLLVYFFITFGMSIYFGKPFSVIPALLIGLFFSLVFSLCLYFIPEQEIEKSEKIEEYDDESCENYDGGEDDEKVNNVRFD